MQTHSLTVDGLGSIAYQRRAGTGPALLIVHGLAGSSIEE